MRFLVLTAAALLAFTISGTANAALIFSWDFTNNNQTFASGDTVPILALLTNDASSTENITTEDFSRAEVNFTGNIDNSTNYTLNFHPGGMSFFDQFNGIDLSPGESFSFQFGELIPVGGSAPLGTYYLGQALLGINDDQGFEMIIASDHEFTFTVNEVPIPGAVLIFLSGVIPLALSRRRLAA